MTLLRRTENPPFCKKFQDYKEHLRRDFEYRCVYCTIHENEYGSHQNFCVEHFKPKSIFPELKCDYNNLFYACNPCNNNKGADWPNKDYFNKLGFYYIDPCEEDYEDHFKLNLTTYKLEHQTNAAMYMIKRIRLNRRQLIRLRLKRDKKNKIKKCKNKLYNMCTSKIATEPKENHTEYLKELLEIIRLIDSLNLEDSIPLKKDDLK